MPLLHRGLECKSRKSRDSWSNRQVWPWSTKCNRAKTNRSLPREHTSHSKRTLPTAQEMTLHVDTTRWSIPNHILFFAAKDGEALYFQEKQDLELIVAQIMSSLLQNSDINWRKWGKTTRLFRYHLNQIPYDYIVEVMRRFKGLDLVDRVPEELWTDIHNIVQEVVTKTILKKKTCNRAKR